MNINFKKAGLAAAICAATVVGGAAAAVPASAATLDSSSVGGYVAERAIASGSLVQGEVPTLAPGQVGDLIAEARFSAATSGHSFVFTAPMGTSFDANTVRTLFSNGYNRAWTGTLSEGGKVLTIDIGEAFSGNVKLITKIKSDIDNAREGMVGGGSVEVTAGPNIPVGTTALLAYKATSILTQGAVPALAPGQVGDLVAEAKFPTTPTSGHSFVFTAPTGTTFDSNAVSTLFSNGYNRAWTGTLSTDNRILTVDIGEAFKGDVKLIAKIKSDSANTRDGLTGGGSVVVTAGAYLPVGTNRELSYTAIDPVAAPGPVEFTGATTDANPVFSGTGTPGATITITLSDGTVLGTTTVAPEGGWTVTSEVELVDGDYTVTATQSGDGLTETTDTITVTVVGAPIADPLIAGGAGMALLAGAGAVFAIRRRRAAQA